jgi:hypothetical protein
MDFLLLASCFDRVDFPSFYLPFSWGRDTSLSTGEGESLTGWLLGFDTFFVFILVWQKWVA